SSVIDMAAPLAAVSGRTQESHVAGFSVCTEPPAAVFSRFSNVVTYFLYASSGDTVWPSLKSAPLPLDVHASTSLPKGVLSLIAPWGRKRKPARVFGEAAVFASAVAAGTMASRKGRPSATPLPRRNVRRERYFLVRNVAIACLPYRLFVSAPCTFAAA